ncbi:MAG: hypothetical protein ACJAVT_000666 [Yoonia sp.]|jgi:hypothetical protein
MLGSCLGSTGMGTSLGVCGVFERVMFHPLLKVAFGYHLKQWSKLISINGLTVYLRKPLACKAPFTDVGAQMLRCRRQVAHRTDG